MSEEPQEKSPILFWVIVVAAGLYVAVRLVEGLICVAAWLGWGTCPWSV